MGNKKALSTRSTRSSSTVLTPPLTSNRITKKRIHDMTDPSPSTSSDPSSSQKGRHEHFIVSEDEEEVEEVEEVEEGEENDQSDEDFVSLPDEGGSQE